KNPEKPSIFLFGGAKFSDVIVTIERLLDKKTADKILLTGLPANAKRLIHQFHTKPGYSFKDVTVYVSGGWIFPGGKLPDASRPPVGRTRGG
ncbi:MAG: hypothetical protein R6U98_25780, partial [Pirellulaceae bacterium]